MIFITGDTHGDIDFAKLKIFADNNPNLTKNDFMIIAGDFGAVWNGDTFERDLKPYTELPFTVLFVDGNHENFEILNSLPIEEWHGGNIHKIKPNIFHLMRGQIFNIEGKTFFTFGGATSIDKIYRTEYISWWRQELPSYAELDEAIENLKKHNNSVDYIVTHSCGERALMYPPLKNRSFQMNCYPENHMLSYFEDIVNYKHWYFGHYHMDAELGDKYTVLYQHIVRLE